MDTLGPYNSGPEYLAATGMYPLSAVSTESAVRISAARSMARDARSSVRDAVRRVRIHRIARKRCVRFGLNDKYDAEQVIDALEDIAFWAEQARHYDRMVRKIEGER